MKKAVFLDHHSTTPCDPRVVKAMKPYWTDCFYNPSSPHMGGELAVRAVQAARSQVAAVINATPDQIYFTPSATVANNIILRGANRDIITSRAEHSSVSECLVQLNNASTRYIDIDSRGVLDYNELENELKRNKFYNRLTLVSVIAASNEIGTINDLHRIGELCKKYRALFHTDATQAIGRVDIDVVAMNIFALSLSSHKIYGPKGCGSLYVRDEAAVEQLIYGGYQDHFVSGTQNVPNIVGLGAACEIIQQQGPRENRRIKKLRDLLWAQLLVKIPDAFVNGAWENRLGNNLNITIPGVPAEVLVRGMDDVLISGGSACNSNNFTPSHIIEALGSPHPNCAVRFGLGRWTTKKEVIYAAERVKAVVESVRK